MTDDYPIFRLLASKTEIKCIYQGIGSEIFEFVYKTYFPTDEQVRQAKFILDHFETWDKYPKAIEKLYFEKQNTCPHCLKPYEENQIIA